VKHDVSKFMKVHAHVVALNIIGTSMCNLELKALDFYKQTYIHCQVFLCEVFKWNKMHKNVKRSTLGNMKRKVFPPTTPNVELDDHVEATFNCDGGFSIGEASVFVMPSSF
jgi:predicted Fe-S protein YdhL (DUF1289 family)